MEMFDEYKEHFENVEYPEKCKLVNQPCRGHVLELRKHYKLKDDREYRCFIRDKKLVAIT